MALAGDVAQVGLVLEGVAVLHRVASRAERLRHRARHRRRLVLAALREVDRGGAVAGLALDVAQALVEREVRAARLLPARDVATDAVEVELLAALLERLPGMRVPRRLPEVDRIGVTVLAGVIAHVVGLALRRCRDRDPGRRVHVGLAGGLEVPEHATLHVRRAGEPLRDAHLGEREVRPGRGHEHRMRDELRALGGDGGALALLLRDEARVGGRVRKKSLQLGVELGELPVERRELGRGERGAHRVDQRSRGGPQRDLEPRDDLATVRRHHEPARPDRLRLRIDELGLRGLLAEPRDREIDAADVAHQLRGVLPRGRLHEPDDHLRALRAEVADGSLARGHGIADHETLDHGQGVRLHDAEDPDLRASELDELGGLEGHPGAADIDGLPCGPDLARTFREVHRPEAQRGHTQLLLPRLHEEIGLELLLRIARGGDLRLGVEQGARIHHERRASRARCRDEPGGPCDVAQGVARAPAGADLAPDLCQREQRERGRPQRARGRRRIVRLGQVAVRFRAASNRNDGRHQQCREPEPAHPCRYSMRAAGQCGCD